MAQKSVPWGSIWYGPVCGEVLEVWLWGCRLRDSVCCLGCHSLYECVWWILKAVIVICGLTTTHLDQLLLLDECTDLTMIRMLKGWEWLTPDIY
jgi:hypothetical protein